MKLDEARIQRALFYRLTDKGHEIVVPNVSHSWLYWEADVISFTKAGLMHEFEIKVSRQDFRNDFTKRKHADMKRILSNGGKHCARIPNYFSYVAPEKAIPLCVPDYAGIIAVYEAGQYGDRIRLSQVRKPVQIHKQKPPEQAARKILRTLMYKYWTLSDTLERNKIQRQLFN